MESNQKNERKTYHEQKYIDNTLRLREILKTLPPFAKDYFRAARTGQPLQKPEFLTLMISVYFFTF